ARARLPSATGAINRTELHLHAGVLQPGLQRRRRAVPHKTEVAARRFRRRRTRREGWVLPARRPVEVDHLRADVDGYRVLVFRHLKSETSIERDYRIDILHRDGDVIEPAYA